jgi:hypothetical protein
MSIDTENSIITQCITLIECNNMPAFEKVLEKLENDYWFQYLKYVASINKNREALDLVMFHENKLSFKQNIKNYLYTDLCKIREPIPEKLNKIFIDGVYKFSDNDLLELLKINIYWTNKYNNFSISNNLVIMFCDAYVYHYDNIDFVIRYLISGIKDSYHKYPISLIFNKYSKYIKSTYLYDIYKHSSVSIYECMTNLDHFISNDLLELPNSNKYLITLMYPMFSKELAIILKKVILTIPPELEGNVEFLEFYNKYTPIVKSAGKK